MSSWLVQMHRTNCLCRLCEARRAFLRMLVETEDEDEARP